jgi:putative ABC transport system permease protein
VSVLRLAVRQLLGRRAATTLAILGLLVATLGFITLVGTAQTTQATLRGDIARTWNTPYDLLVRPAAAATPLEAAEGLVRPNFVSGLSGGGISRAQLDATRRIPGVRVAAPVAVAGTANWMIGGFGVDLAGQHPRRPLEAYQVEVTSTTDAGLSTGAVATHRLLVASEGVVRYPEFSRDAMLSLRGRTIPCPEGEVSCFAPTVCEHGSCGPPEDATPSWGVELLQPIVVAGVDPDAEAALAGLDRCVVAGRYLTDGDHLREATDRDPPGERIPALVSRRSFVDETLTARLARAADPSALLAGTPPAHLGGWRAVRRSSTTIDRLYRSYLRRLGQEVDEWPVWAVGDVSYRQRGGRLAAAAERPDTSIYQRQNFRPSFGVEPLVPPAARDRWFRPVTQHGYRGLEGNKYWDAVGTYDPACLPGFDPLAGGGLEAYATPGVRLPDGRELRPNRSPAGYVNSPPLVLTTLEGAAWFADPAHFQGRPGGAFISVVRVRVDGVDQPGRLAEARLARIAADIHDATGLRVDIVKGASPRPLQVDLPAGRLGRPALTVTEPWSVKGVALRFTRTVSAQNVGLFSLALVDATILVGTTAYSSVRRRRREFGVLRALGWPSPRIALLVELETLLAGLAAGVAALAAGLPLAAQAGVRALPWTVAAAVPLALAIAGLAALLPALSAARGATLTILTSRGRVRRSRPPRSAVTLGLRDLAGMWRVEALLGAGAIGLGAAMLGGVVLIATAFRGRLDTTVLGVYLAGRVHPFHLVVAVLTLGIGALAAGQVVTLGYLERQTQLAVLRALGWPRRQVLRLLAAQGLALGVAGGLAGALAVWAMAGITGAAPGATGRATAAAAGAALVATALAIAGPLAYAVGSRPTDALRGE